MTTFQTDSAVHLPLDGWSDIMRVEHPDARALAMIGAAAVSTDLALRNGLVGFAAAVLVAVMAGGVLGSGLVVNRAAVPMLLAAPAFGAFLAVRTSPWLVVLDLFAAATLTLLGASFARGGDPLDVSLPNVLGRGVYAAGHWVLAPAYPFLARARATGRGRGLAPVVRGLMFAAPAVLVVGTLLASADAVFASFFRLPTDVGELVLHMFLFVIGGWAASTVLRFAAAEAFAMPSRRTAIVGSVEAATVLGALAAILGLFAVSQVVAAVRGAAYVERTAGLTYAEYARRGFFQLLAVALVTLAVLLAARAAVGGSPPPAPVLVAGEVVVALTLVVVGIAVRRLFLYEQAYGLTMLRLVSVLFACWIGVVFLLTAMSWAGAGRRQWLVPAAIVTALAGLFAANVADLERIVVTRNVDRFAGTYRGDPYYLTSLSDDAVPALISAVPRLRPEDQDVVRRAVCAERPGRLGVWRYNTSRARADRARTQFCGFSSP